MDHPRGQFGVALHENGKGLLAHKCSLASMSSCLFSNGKRFAQHVYPKEEDLERVVASNAKAFFGTDTIYVDAKNRIGTQFLGGAVPDGVLFDLSDIENPEFYLVEVELSSHDFNSHIFPQITKFFAFFKNQRSQNELTDKLFTIINKDEALRDEFRSRLKEREVFKFLKDTIDNSKNVLIVIDGDKKEFPEIMEAYTDTWGKVVTIIILKEFRNDGEYIYSMNPEFSTIQLEVESPGTVSGEGRPTYTEEDHLEGVADSVKAAYYELKKALLEHDKATLNPQKYYISVVHGRNRAFFKFRRKKLNIVVMLEEPEVRSMVRHHEVHSLSKAVQDFYNGPCCRIILNNADNLDEVLEVLRKAISRT